ncbi:hypothetical protein ACFWBB_18210 [Streptomyces sp. NPDC060000]|uniref:hypothetical protein n=1 Tax=Streptomyces sp. NPDC060000 TaxID=3347031 RepID=UPI00369A7482
MMQSAKAVRQPVRWALPLACPRTLTKPASAARAYNQPISTRPETLLMQMRGYAIVTAAEAQGDDLIGELVRAGWMRIWEAVRLSLGADSEEIASFFACGMLGNALAAICFP